MVRVKIKPTSIIRGLFCCPDHADQQAERTWTYLSCGFGVRPPYCPRCGTLLRLGRTGGDRAMKIAGLLKEIDHALWVLEEHDKLHFGVNHNTVAEAQAAREKLQIVTEVSAQLVAALDAAKVHLEYCGYGRDSWERECSEGLPEKIEAALSAAGFYDIEPKRGRKSHDNAKGL